MFVLLHRISECSGLNCFCCAWRDGKNEENPRGVKYFVGSCVGREGVLPVSGRAFVAVLARFQVSEFGVKAVIRLMI